MFQTRGVAERRVGAMQTQEKEETARGIEFVNKSSSLNSLCLLFPLLGTGVLKLIYSFTVNRLDNLVKPMNFSQNNIFKCISVHIIT